MKRILATITDGDETVSSLYTSMQKWHEATFSPEIEIVNYFPLKVSGKTYAERKAYLQNLAIEISNSEFYEMSWWEMAEAQNFFETNGRRYGLLKEFRENAIC